MESDSSVRSRTPPSKGRTKQPVSVRHPVTPSSRANCNGQESKRNAGCCTTGKRRNAFIRRCPVREEDDGAVGEHRRLKPCNVFSPLSKLRPQPGKRIPSGNESQDFRNSFETNQSFPRVRQQPRRYVRRVMLNVDTSPLVTRVGTSCEQMDRVRVDGSNGVRFTAFRPKGCASHGIASPYNNSYIASASESIGRLPKTGINPNKAVFTIDSKTSRILIVNRNACELLGYSSKELCEMQFASLLPTKNKMHVSALAEGQLNSEDGTVIILSGKVVELSTKGGKRVAVSLWVRQIDNEGCCLAVAEPVERRVAQLLVDKNGYVISGDNEALMLFQLDSVEKFGGMDVSLLVPAIQLPDADSSAIAKHIRKQKATGKTQEGVSFPLCLMISPHDAGTDTTDSGLSNSNALYLVTIWVFTNLSGLLVIDETSVIESCNHHFSMLMFGFPQSKILGEHITKIIPNFGQDCDYMGFVNRSRNATLSSLDNDESETETDHVEFENKEEFLQNAINSMKSVPNVSSPMKEARKVCLDFTTGSVGNSRIEGNSGSMSMSLPCGPDVSRIDESSGLFSSIVMTSVPENLLYAESNSENNPNYANVSNSVSCGALKPATTVDIRDAQNKSTVAGEDYANLADCDLLTPVNDNSMCMNLLVSKNGSVNGGKPAMMHLPEDTDGALLHDMTAPSSAPPTMVTPRYVKPYELMKTIVTSTPDQQKRLSTASLGGARKTVFTDGKYRGEAIHYDGNVIDILYTISNQTLPCGRKVYCIWISRDPESPYNNLEDEEKHQNLTLTFNSITSTMDNSLGQAIKNTAAAQNASRPNSVSLMSQCEEEQVCGEYNKYYTTIKQVGKGAYGYVKLSYRNTDRLLVISKFILKEKLCPNFMIKTDDKKEIPMEIYLLTHVQHPNIVTVYDVFENEKFFQLVMEVHGSGMDLFEFIDRRPAMTEKLGCYIFRQIAHAVDYLHSLHILHRDIKDENIIIDHNFHVKLIDFGSATFMQEGKLFSTFYGTTEYCSPEVLAGNKYAGPELEMWSLGVTLYVLMFFENPFLDIEETLKSELIIPQDISEELEYVLLSMLDKNPKTRITMKELMESEWLTQDIHASAFNFATIVPCEPYEVNPEKYFNGQIYSSQTGLSTSPHSLSLVDDDDDDDDEHAHIDDSFIDPEELLEDEVCPLSQDDERNAENREGKELNLLTANMSNIALKEHSSTCISYINADKASQPASGTGASAGGANLEHCDTQSDDDVVLVVVNDAAPLANSTDVDTAERYGDGSDDDDDDEHDLALLVSLEPDGICSALEDILSNTNSSHSRALSPIGRSRTGSDVAYDDDTFDDDDDDDDVREGENEAPAPANGGSNVPPPVPASTDGQRK